MDTTSGAMDRRGTCYLFTRRRGANTAHTHMGRPTHEAPTREYTHKHTQTQTNAQRGPTKYGAGYLLYLLDGIRFNLFLMRL